MKINRDFFDHPVVPDYVLCKANRERIGILPCTEKTIDFKFNDLDEISFTTYLYNNTEKNPCYDAVDVMKYVFLPEVGFFSVISVTIESEGTEMECKKVTAKSYECLLAQKYLEEFTINMGTVQSIDGVQFYNLREKDKSLLHLVLEKCPDWSIGHIDTALPTMQRSFEVSRQDVYSFLNNDVAEAFSCFFLFDTLHHTINIYGEDRIGKDTNIHVSYGNLLKSTNLSCTTDTIKTCLSITGSDDLTVREINMGYDKIYNLGYYNSTEFMSRKLHEAYNRWTALKAAYLPAYNTLLSQYQAYYSQISFLDHVKMPSVTESTDWTEYGLQPLKEQLSAYEQRQAVLMKTGQGDPSSPFYSSRYLPLYHTIQEIQAQIKDLESQIESLREQQNAVSMQMSEIISAVSMPNNFSEDELKELSTFIREEELSSSNYVVTDSMADEERLEVMHDLLKFGERELAKASVPQLTFQASLVNLFALPEFAPFQDDFEPGNFVWVTLRDDFSIKAKLLSLHVNFFDPTDFSVTFGNVAGKSQNRCLDITEVIREASSAATSVSFNSSYWNRSAKDTSLIGQMLDEGLIAAGKHLKNGDDSELIIDSRGIFVNATSGQYAGKDSVFIGGGRILFTDDNWKTVSEAIGRIDVKGESVFGVLAQAVLAGYIAGCEIVAGNIFSSNYAASPETGTRINLDDGTFSFADGKIAFDGSKLTLKETEIDWNTVNEFKVNAGNVDLSADDVIHMLSGGAINLTGKNISITSDNFKVDAGGNVQCNNITAFSISGNAVNQFNTVVENTQAMRVASEAISKAQNALARIEKAIDDLNNIMFPQVNRQINELQVKVAALESRL